MSSRDVNGSSKYRIRDPTEHRISCNTVVTRISMVNPWWSLQILEKRKSLGDTMFGTLSIEDKFNQYLRKVLGSPSLNWAIQNSDLASLTSSALDFLDFKTNLGGAREYNHPNVKSFVMSVFGLKCCSINP